MIIMQRRAADTKDLLKEWRIDSVFKFPNMDTQMWTRPDLWSIQAEGPELVFRLDGTPLTDAEVLASEMGIVANHIQRAEEHLDHAKHCLALLEGNSNAY